MTRSCTSASALALAAASLLLFALPAVADDGSAAAGSARPDPGSARAEVPPVAYRSAFSGYRPLAEGKVGWKEANDEVGRIGGWRTYAREANAPEPSSGEPRPDAPQGAAAGKAGSAAPPKHGAHDSHGAPGKHKNH